MLFVLLATENIRTYAIRTWTLNVSKLISKLWERQQPWGRYSIYIVLLKTFERHGQLKDNCMLSDYGRLRFCSCLAIGTVHLSPPRTPNYVYSLLNSSFIYTICTTTCLQFNWQEYWRVMNTCCMYRHLLSMWRISICCCKVGISLLADDSLPSFSEDLFRVLFEDLSVYDLM